MSLAASVVRAMVLAAVLVATPPASADDGETWLDGTAVRYYAPETGGAAKPLFLTHRVVAFQAKLEAKGEDSASDGPQERHVRAAVDRLVVEGILSALPRERASDAKELAALIALFRQAIVERVGEATLTELARGEGLSSGEVDSILRHRARAALYADRALGAVLYPSEDQLRDVFRTAPHPYRSRAFDEARAAFTVWFVEERLRALETAFLQAARSRIRVLPVRR